MPFEVFRFLGLYLFGRNAASKAELAVALSHIVLLKAVKAECSEFESNAKVAKLI